MWFIGKLSRDKRGAGSIIGATFIVLILLTGYTFYFLNIDATDDYNDTLEDMAERDQKRNKENLEFISVSFNGGELNITVENTGSYYARLIWLGIFDDDANTEKYYEIDFCVNPAETVTDIGNDTISSFEDQERVIQLVTELGNIFSYSYPEESSENGGDEIYDYVDDMSNEDGSDDKGTHSLFAAEKAGPDGVVDTLTEASAAGENVENDVDTNDSDEDGSADKGTETNFANAQGTSLDSSYMNIQETNTGGSSSLSLYVDVDDESRTGDWTRIGANPYLDAIDYSTNYVCVDGNNKVIGDYGFTGSGKSTETINTVTIQLYAVQSLGSKNLEVFVWDGSSWGSLGTQTTPTSWDWMSWTATMELDTWTKIDAAEIYIKSQSGGGLYEVDSARLQIGYTTSENYQVDFEYNWTTAAYSSENEKVCIYLAAHGDGSETLNVNYWSGSSWTLLGTVTATDTWTNLTATGLTASTYTIQLIGASESGDTTQDDWDIDLITLHTWGASSYELDLEVQWTDVDHDETNEWVCIYGGTMGSEDILVDVWNGAAWENVLTDLSSGWNSVDVSSYLDSATFTIRFRSISDAVQADEWEIDAAFLYVWS